jgi:hypothetical protein
MSEQTKLVKDLQEMTKNLNETEELTIQDEFNNMHDGYLRFRFNVEVPKLRFCFINEYKQCLFVAEIED